ncbi:MAG: hypothetical protein IT497_10260 [Ottowia sp.]|nr:hypothetical protein [Ottowia sp.]
MTVKPPQENTESVSITPVKTPTPVPFTTISSDRLNAFNWGDRQAHPSMFLGRNSFSKNFRQITQVRNAYLWDKRWQDTSYVQQHPYLAKLRTPAGTLVSAVSIANAGIGLGLHIKSFVSFCDDESRVASEKWGKAGDVGIAAAAFTAHVFGELDKMTLVYGGLKNIKWFGGAQTSLTILTQIIKLPSSFRYLGDPSASLEKKIILGLETGMDISGGIGQVLFGALATSSARAAQAAYAAKVAQGLAVAGKPALTTAQKIPLVGLLVSAVLVSVNASQIYYGIKEYRDGDTFSSSDVMSLQMLGEIYKSKGIADLSLSSVQALINITGVVVQVALMAGGVTAPLALVAAVVAGVFSSLLDAAWQPILEKIAQQQHDKIGPDTFTKELFAQYQSLLSDIGSQLAKEQKGLQLDYMVAVTQLLNNPHQRELAAIAKRAKYLPSGAVYIDKFIDGHVVKAIEKDIFLDAKNGLIDLTASKAGVRQGLVFTTPLLTPGTERLDIKSGGEDKFLAELKFLEKGAWQINDGAADTIVDVSNIVQRAKRINNTVRNVELQLKMNAGKDHIIASSGRMVLDGGADEDTVDYSQIKGDFVSIKVAAQTDGSYKVTKTSTGTNVAQEVTKTEKHRYGKRTDSLQYRSIEIKKETVIAEDELKAVERIMGAKDGTEFIGGDRVDIFYGSNANDLFSGGKGNDFLVGAKGNDVYTFCKGDGHDTIIDLDETIGNTDELKIVGVRKEELWLQKKGADLEISILGTQDKVTIRGWYLGPTHQIERILLDGGSVLLSPKQIDSLVAAMAVSVKPGKDQTRWLSATYFTQILATAAINIDLQLTADIGGQIDLTGKESDDILRGNNKENILFGHAGADTLEGRQGNDVLNGGLGNDRYIFSRGDGHDTIIDLDETVGNLDSLVLQDIDLENVWLQSHGDHLEISILGTQDKITIRNWYLGNAYEIEHFELKGSVVLTATQVSNLAAAMAMAIKPNAQQTRWLRTPDFSAVLAGTKGITVDLNITPLPVNDEGGNVVIGTTLDDVLRGDAKANALIGNAGNDRLEGRGGKDFLDGGKGNDRYIFARGDGQDIVIDFDDAVSNSDTLVLLDIAQNNLWLQRSGEQREDLEVSILGTTDKITIRRWYIDKAHQIERFELKNGVVLNLEQINNLAAAMAVTAKPVSGQTDWPVNHGFTDILAGKKGITVNLATTSLPIDDVAGTTLNDHLSGNAKNNVFHAGKGADSVFGYAGDDYIFQNIDFEVDTIDGGNGFDVVDYSLTDLKLGTLIPGFSRAIDEKYNHIGVHVDLAKGFTQKLPGVYVVHKMPPLATKDHTDKLISIEGVVGTTLRDVLLGDEKNNLLVGLGGSDRLEGRGGNDALNGGKGNDLYSFYLGDGEDVITDNDETAGNEDILYLTNRSGDPYVTRDRLSFEQIGFDLKILIENGAQKNSITISNWYLGKNHHIEKIQFYADEILSSEIESLVKARAHSRIYGAQDDAIDQNIDTEGDTIDGGGGVNTVSYGVTNLAGAKPISATYNPGIFVDLTEGVVRKRGSDAGKDSVRNIQNIMGTVLDDSFVGNGENNKFYGGAGRDVFIGHGGADTLSGDSGNDVYIYAKGDGHDTIIDFDTTAGNIDILKLININKEMLWLSRDGDNLDITLLGTTDKITLSNWYLGEDHQIEKIELLSGEKLSPLQINNLATVMAYVSKPSTRSWGASLSPVFNAVLNGTQGITVDLNITQIEGDEINGTTLNDRLCGNNKNNTLIGHAGDDELEGRGGNDELQGGLGNDRYIFKSGDGEDFIADVDETVGNMDTLVLKEFTKDQLSFQKIDNDLKISIIKAGANDGQKESITVAGWYLGSAYHVEQIELKDGISQMDSLLSMMAMLPPITSTQASVLPNYPSALNLAFSTS